MPQMQGRLPTDRCSAAPNARRHHECRMSVASLSVANTPKPASGSMALRRTWKWRVSMPCAASHASSAASFSSGLRAAGCAASPWACSTSPSSTLPLDDAASRCNANAAAAPAAATAPSAAASEGRPAQPAFWTVALVHKLADVLHDDATLLQEPPIARETACREAKKAPVAALRQAAICFVHKNNIMSQMRRHAFYWFCN